ncbi:hypothetical protein TNCT_145981 [Trichonephila clavata]|uniref:Uncharacterized protein n=1 Tax=Trichonephila clavata TaxID=2740835 RepID=A0A8X6JC89_TRICU|nr:hypothetical protein TNCT_145981 [Trichonephila clavata]
MWGRNVGVEEEMWVWGKKCGCGRRNVGVEEDMWVGEKRCRRGKRDVGTRNLIKKDSSHTKLLVFPVESKKKNCEHKRPQDEKTLSSRVAWSRWAERGTLTVPDPDLVGLRTLWGDSPPDNR